MKAADTFAQVFMSLSAPGDRGFILAGHLQSYLSCQQKEPVVSGQKIFLKQI